jgi:hypothetical protein
VKLLGISEASGYNEPVVFDVGVVVVVVVVVLVEVELDVVPEFFLRNPPPEKLVRSRSN